MTFCRVVKVTGLYVGHFMSHNALGKVVYDKYSLIKQYIPASFAVAAQKQDPNERKSSWFHFLFFKHSLLSLKVNMKHTHTRPSESKVWCPVCSLCVIPLQTTPCWQNTSGLESQSDIKEPPWRKVSLWEREAAPLMPFSYKCRWLII